jgi:hypothetical protein
VREERPGFGGVESGFVWEGEGEFEGSLVADGFDEDGALGGEERQREKEGRRGRGESTLSSFEVKGEPGNSSGVRWRLGTAEKCSRTTFVRSSRESG